MTKLLVPSRLVDFQLLNLVAKPVKEVKFLFPIRSKLEELIRQLVRQEEKAKLKEGQVPIDHAAVMCAAWPRLYGPLWRLQPRYTVFWIKKTVLVITVRLAGVVRLLWRVIITR